MSRHGGGLYRERPAGGATRRGRLPGRLGEQVGAPRAVDPRAALAWLERKIAFENRPLGEVAEEFNRYGRIPIEIEDQEMRSLPISGVFDAYDTDSFAAFLGRLGGVQVEKTPTRILVRKFAPATREPCPSKNNVWGRARVLWTDVDGGFVRGRGVIRSERAGRSHECWRAACPAFFSPCGRARPVRHLYCRSTFRRSPWRARWPNLRSRPGCK